MGGMRVEVSVVGVVGGVRILLSLEVMVPRSSDDGLEPSMIDGKERIVFDPLVGLSFGFLTGTTLVYILSNNSLICS